MLLLMLVIERPVVAMVLRQNSPSFIVLLHVPVQRMSVLIPHVFVSCEVGVVSNGVDDEHPHFHQA